MLLAVDLVSHIDPALFSESGGGRTELIQRQSISADGRYVAFQSEAPNLVSGDLNNAHDIFRYDRQTGLLELVSVNAAGTGSGNRGSFNPVISADGSVVAFESSAQDLHPLDANSFDDVYARTFSGTPTTRLISVNAAGNGGGNGRSQNAVISANGSVIAFESQATNLLAVDTSAVKDVYAVRDVWSATPSTHLVSVNTAASGGGDHQSFNPQISDDGSIVLFSSEANNLHALDADNLQDVFIRRFVGAPTTELVSVNAAGTSSGNGFSFDAVISGDGTAVAFGSTSTDLTAMLDANGSPGDVFVRNLASGVTQLVSVNEAGTGGGNGFSTNPSISGDGSVVVYQSRANDLEAVDTNTIQDIFARNVGSVSPATQLVSVNSAGTNGGNFDSSNPLVSADGLTVVFESQANNLHAQDANSAGSDIFARSLSGSPATRLVSVNATGATGGNSTSFHPVISADGSVIAFDSNAYDLVARDFNVNPDIFIATATAPIPALVSHIEAGLTSQSGGRHSQVFQNQSLSADGRYVAFQSLASNLVPGDLNGNFDVFRYDRLTGAIQLVSTNSAGTGSANRASMNPVISADGSVVAFESSATDLHPLDVSITTDIYARSFSGAPTTRLISVNAAGTAAGNGQSTSPALNSDGSMVTFVSAATNLTNLVDHNGANTDVFVRSLAGTPATTLVSINAAGTGSGNGASQSPAISVDGLVIAFTSAATDLTTLVDSNGAQGDVFVRTVSGSPATSLVSVNAVGTASGNGISANPVISADGSVVAFESFATNLTPDADTNSKDDVFTRNLTGVSVTSLVSVNAAGTGSGNGSSRNAAISADGSVVAFESAATNLTNLADANGDFDVFVRTMAGTPATQIVSVNTVGTGSGNGISANPVLSADGSVVAFESGATNLTTNVDQNFKLDVYIRTLSGTAGTRLVSVNSAGAHSGNNLSSAPALNAGGSVIAFTSDATNLVAADYNNAGDVFIQSFNSPPVVEDQAFSVAEDDSGAGPFAAIVAADAESAVTFAVTGGTGAALFDVDLDGDLSAIGVLDYDTGPTSYTLTIEVSDAGGLSDTATIIVDLLPVNDNNPAITSPNNFNVNENATAVGAVVAADNDLPGDDLLYSISGGADAGLFAIDQNTGALTFVAARDYENPADAGLDNVYQVEVTADDQAGGTPAIQLLDVSIQPVNEHAPVFTSSDALQIDEQTTVVVTLTATDADSPLQSISFTISGGADQNLFTIAAGNQLQFSTAPDFEAPSDANLDGIYLVEVTADDGHGQTTLQAVAVTAQDVIFFTADFDLDDDVDGNDLTNWRNGFGSSPPPTLRDGDADGDGDVDGADFLLWQRQLGSSASVTALAAVSSQEFGGLNAVDEAFRDPVDDITRVEGARISSWWIDADLHAIQSNPKSRRLHAFDKALNDWEATRFDPTPVDNARYIMHQPSKAELVVTSVTRSAGERQLQYNEDSDIELLIELDAEV